MTDTTRDRILDVTARVFADAGYRGTTTRRVAQEAGVNEVTLFRHFGSKDALIKAALEMKDREGLASLPADPDDPATELCAWARQVHAHTHAHRTLIRRVMGDMVDRPEITPAVCADAGCEYAQLTAYIERLRARGLATGDFDAHAASAMLIGALFTDALWRDMIPYLPPADVTVREYVRVLLLALGVRHGAAAGAACAPAPEEAP